MLKNIFNPQLGEIEDTDELCEVLIRIQPGAWAEKFLNREGEQENKALHQFGYIHQAAFEINPNRQELAAVLTLYLTQNRRAHSSCKYRIRTLLEAVIAPQELESVRQVRQYRSRFVQRFYDALEILTEAGFKIEFDESFPTQLRPEWANIPEESDGIDVVALAPVKTPLPSGYFDIWIDGIIRVTCPSDIEAVLANLEARKAGRGRKVNGSSTVPATPTRSLPNTSETSTSPMTVTIQPVLDASEFTGARVRKLRKSLKISQTELAQSVGKSQSWVRDLENKFSDRPIPPEYVDQLRQVLRV